MPADTWILPGCQVVPSGLTSHTRLPWSFSLLELPPAALQSGSPALAQEANSHVCTQKHDYVKEIILNHLFDVKSTHTCSTIQKLEAATNREPEAATDA